jgi:hypothetical protein
MGGGTDYRDSRCLYVMFVLNKSTFLSRRLRYLEFESYKSFIRGFSGG